MKVNCTVIVSVMLYEDLASLIKHLFLLVILRLLQTQQKFLLEASEISRKILE